MPEPNPSFDREPAPIPGQVSPPVLPAEMPSITGLLTFFVFVVVVAALYLAREVLIPITLSVLLSFLLAPLVDLLRVLRLGRVPSVLLAVVIGLGLIMALAGLIGTQIAALAHQVPAYQATVEHKIEAVRDFTVSHVSALVNSLGSHLGAPPASQSHGGAPAPAAAGQGPKPVQGQPAFSAVGLAESVLAPIVSPLATTGIVFVVSIFILLQREDLRDRLIRVFGSGDLHRTTVAMDEAAHRLSRYFLAQLSVNAGFGCVIGSGLALIGVPSPILWGIVSMLLRFVPYIGAPMAAVLPVALAAAVSPGWSMAIETALLYLVVELITGQAVEPLLYGHSTGLSPVSVVVAAIFWTWIWGPIGLILSTPLTLCAVVLGKYVKRLEFLDVLLGDRPALTPVESFYQRMLAGDPDEAQDQAEELLKDRPLSAYYDEVALQGLQLAANDAARGVLTGKQLERIKGAMRSLVRDLDHYEDTVADPAPHRGLSLADRLLHHHAEPEPQAVGLAPDWEAETAVLCVAGRGPLDESAAAILAQLLGKHGLGAQVLPYEAVSRGGITALPVEGVAMICLCFLELAGTPAHLRFLLRRIRSRLPGRPVLVGFWAESDFTPRDSRLRAAAGADHFVYGFGEAVSLCVNTARRPAAPAKQATRETA